MSDSDPTTIPPATAKPYLWCFDHSSSGIAAMTETFSVGVYQWLPAKSGNGLKKSKSIRVAGYAADPQAVYTKAQQLCAKLNRSKVNADAPPEWLQKQYSTPRPAASVKKLTVNNPMM